MGDRDAAVVSLLDLPSDLLIRVCHFVVDCACPCDDTVLRVCRELRALRDALLNSARYFHAVRQRLRTLSSLTTNRGRVYCERCGSAVMNDPQPPRPTSLHVLPIELLGLIATHVQVRAGIPALLSYSRASQSCRLAVEHAAAMQQAPLSLASCDFLLAVGTAVSSWHTRIWLLHLLQHGDDRERLGILDGALTADHATALVRHRGADSTLVGAALRLECEVTVLLDALDEMGYLVETQGVEPDVLCVRSAERRGLVDRMSSLRLHRDAVLTVVGLDAVREARAYVQLACFGIQWADLEKLRGRWAAAPGPTGHNTLGRGDLYSCSIAEPGRRS